MSITTPAPLAALSWHRVQVDLQCTRTSERQHEHPLLVFNAILKSIHWPGEGSAKLVFHLPGTPHQLIRIRRNQIYPLEVLFFGARLEDLRLWIEALRLYLAEDSIRNFALVSAGAPERRCLDDLPQIPRGLSEICLEWLTPLPFPTQPGRPRTWLDSRGLQELLDERIAQLFGVCCALPDPSSNLILLSGYWHYDEIRHASRSQPGHTQYYNGCTGRLYLKGSLDPWLPWLRLVGEVHLAPRTKYRMLGYFRLSPLAPAYFSPSFPDHGELTETVRRLCAQDEQLALAAATEQGVPFSAEAYARSLEQEIRAARYRSQPTRVSRIAKPDGGTRLIEQLTARDRVVHQHLLHTLAAVFEPLLHPSAIGYRKGHSWQEAGERIRALAQQGYRYAIRGDILDFFPSIDLERLWARLDQELPTRDAVMRRLLWTALHTDRQDEDRIEPRRQGLIQGSPLSPLLANLFLTPFDEAVTRGEAQLLRYGDDCLILARRRDEANAALERGRTVLRELGLAFNETKSTSGTLDDGFRFLGQHFGGSHPEPEAEPQAPLKRTLVISEPYAFLAMNGAAVEVRRDGKTLATLPLRAIDGILVLGRNAISTTLVDQCGRLGIPLTIGDMGNRIPVTFSAGNKPREMAAFIHASRFFDMSERERLAIAQRIAAAKIAGYQTLLKQRYTAGVKEMLEEMTEHMEAIAKATDTHSIRGHEGVVAKRVFATLRQFVQVPEFEAEQRSRPARDRFNALLNFASYLTFGRLNALVRGQGLNPYLGFLHDGDNPYESLVADLQELFRALLDRAVLRMINLRIVQAEHFRPGQDTPRLDGEGQRRFLEQFERTMHTPVGSFTLQQAMIAQVGALRRFFLEGAPLWLFRWEAS